MVPNRAMHHILPNISRSKGNQAMKFVELEYVHMSGEMNSDRYEISFRLKISLRYSVSSLLVLTWMLTGMRFSCEQNLLETKWISADSLNITFNAHVCLKLIAGMDFISVILIQRYAQFWFFMKGFHSYQTHRNMSRVTNRDTRTVLWNIFEGNDKS